MSSLILYPFLIRFVFLLFNCKFQIFPGSSEGKVSAYNAGNPGSIPGSGRSPGEGNGNPLQYSCLENPMDGGAWLATVQGVTKSWTRLRHFTLKENELTFWMRRLLFRDCGLRNMTSFHLSIPGSTSWPQVWH